MLVKLKIFIHNLLFGAPVSLADRAKEAGVTIGTDNLVESEFWRYAEPYLITVGSNCQITHNAYFFTHGGAQACRRLRPDFDVFGKVKIGDYVYIGSNSIIMPGVIIEDNVLVAAGSVVTSSIPSGYVVGGNPAKIICKLDDYIQRNLPYDLDTKGLSYDEKKEILTRLDDDKFITKKFLSEK